MAALVGIALIIIILSDRFTIEPLDDYQWREWVAYYRAFPADVNAIPIPPEDWTVPMTP